MKFQELETTYDKRLREYIAGRVSAMGATEEAAIASPDAEGLSRVLIATDAGLLDCHFLPITPEGPHFEIKVTPWPDAPHAWIVMTSFVNPGWSVEGGNVTLALNLDPRFSVTQRDGNAAALHDFARAVRSHTKGGSAE